MHAISQASWEPLLLLAVSWLGECESCFKFISLSQRIPYARYPPPPGLHWVVPGSYNALLETEWEWGKSRVMKTCMADVVAWHLLETPGSMGSPQCAASLCRSRSLLLVWFTLPTLPFCTPQCQQQGEPLLLSLGPVPDGCFQEGFYRNQGQEKPAHQVQCSNARDGRAGRGVIFSKAEASMRWRGQGKVFPSATPVLRRGGTFGLSTLVPCFPRSGQFPYCGLFSHLRA